MKTKKERKERNKDEKEIQVLKQKRKANIKRENKKENISECTANYEIGKEVNL